MIHFIATTLMISASALPAEAEEGPLYDFTPPGGRQPNWQEIELQKQKSLQQVAEKQFRSLTTGRETQKVLGSLTEFEKPFEQNWVPDIFPVTKTSPRRVKPGSSETWSGDETPFDRFAEEQQNSNSDQRIINSITISI